MPSQFPDLVQEGAVGTDGRPEPGVVGLRDRAFGVGQQFLGADDGRRCVDGGHVGELQAAGRMGEAERV
ncbi:MAG: hypothetical protein ACKO3N_18155, partial [Verrucomicrobiota bacterium]